jgi:hypothetical protein
LSCREDSLNAKHKRVHGIAGLDAARSGIRMPNIMIDEFLLMIIIAGFGLAVAYLRAEYVVHLRFKAAEHEKLIVQRELHAQSSLRREHHVEHALCIRGNIHQRARQSALFGTSQARETVARWYSQT